MNGVDEFTREDIEELLAALGVRLRARGVAATVYVVGGAAIALQGVSSQRRTADVDALTQLDRPHITAIDTVADRGVCWGCGAWLIRRDGRTTLGKSASVAGKIGDAIKEDRRTVG